MVVLYYVRSGCQSLHLTSGLSIGLGAIPLPIVELLQFVFVGWWPTKQFWQPLGNWKERAAALCLDGESLVT